MRDEQFQHFVEQYRGPIERLIESGAFEYRNATVTLDFNNDGTLMSVKVHSKIYQR